MKMKKTTSKIIALGLALIICLASCGGDPDKNISLYDMQKAMVDAGNSFPEMITVNNNDSDAQKNFTYICDFDYSKIDGYFLSYSKEGLADEIVVIRTNKSNDVTDALSGLKEHVEDRIKLYDQYEPEQAIRARNAITFTKENYAVLIISEDSKDIRDAFEEFFK